MMTEEQMLAAARRAFDAKQFDEVKRIAEAVILRHGPSDSSASILGMAAYRLGEYSNAIRWFRVATGLVPDNVMYHATLGAILKGAGDLRGAKASCEAALRLDACSLAGHANLAGVLGQLGDHARALEHAMAALDIDPACVPARVTMCVALGQQQRFEEMYLHCQRVLELVPNHADALALIGEYHAMNGQTDQAVACWKAAFEANPEFMLSVEGLAKLAQRGLYTFAPDEVDRLKNLFDSRRQPIPNRIQTGFALGSILDGRGEYADAFRYCDAANGLKCEIRRATGNAFDPDSHRVWVDQLIAKFTDQYFRDVRGMGIDSSVPVFVVGMPRSGTTLVERILASHPEVFGAGERMEIGQIVRSESKWRLAGTQECLLDRGASRIEGLARGYVNRMVRISGPRASRVIDKFPENYLHLAAIATMFPNARVIHCRRHPLDTCLSCFFQNFAGIRWSTKLEDIGRYWLQYRRLIEHWREYLPIVMMDVSYEQLVVEQERVSRDLVEFCGLGWDDACLRFFEKDGQVSTASRLQVRQGVYSSSVGKWRNYREQLRPLIDILDEDVAAL